MSITPEQIDMWRSARSETQNLEFKEAKTLFNNQKRFRKLFQRPSSRD